MKYKSALMTQGSGSVGGLTASYNSGGNYFRARVHPADPATCRQKMMRAILSGLVSAWIEKTPTSRQEWDTYADNVPLTPAFCGEIKLTGQQQYIRANSARVQAGLPILETAPSIFDTGVPPMEFSGTTIVGSPSTISGVIDMPAPASVTGTALIYAGRPQNPSVNFYGGPYQLAATAAVAANATAINWTAVVGTTWMSDYIPSTTQQLPLEARITYNDGRMTTKTSCMGTPEEGTTS